MLGSNMFLTACLAPQGLERLAEYDYVAIFDADFKPDADFLVSMHASIQCSPK